MTTIVSIPNVNFSLQAPPAVQQIKLPQPTVQPNLSSIQQAPFTVSRKHAIPNLSAWTFSVPGSQPQPILPVPQAVVSYPQVIPTPAVGTTVTTASAPVMPVHSGGTVFYCHPQQSTVPNVTTSAQQASTSPLNVHAPVFTPPGTTVTPQITPTAVTVQDLAQLITATKRDHLLEWKVAQYNGDPLQWHEWFGQFKSAIDSTTLSDDVKLTYLKTLVTGKAKTAIAEFVYCGTMYRDALQTLERKFGQPHAVVTVYLDKLSSVPPLKMHNSENIINYSATISGIVGVFRSLKYDHDLSSASLLAQAVQKLPPNMKEGWSLHVVKRNLARPTLLDFNDWLKEKAEAHERMKASSNKPKMEESSPSATNTTKTSTNVFASASSSAATSSKSTAIVTKFAPCVVCKEKHPLWRCSVFRDKTPTESKNCCRQQIVFLLPQR